MIGQLRDPNKDGYLGFFERMVSAVCEIPDECLNGGVKDPQVISIVIRQKKMSIFYLQTGACSCTPNVWQGDNCEVPVCPAVPIPAGLPLDRRMR